jgi:hypothetical protein
MNPFAPKKTAHTFNMEKYACLTLSSPSILHPRNALAKINKNKNLYDATRRLGLGLEKGCVLVSYNVALEQKGVVKGACVTLADPDAPIGVFVFFVFLFY